MSTPDITVHAYPSHSWLIAETTHLSPVHETIVDMEELIKRCDTMMFWKRLIPFVEDILKTRYSKCCITDPTRVACGLCTKVGKELAHLAKAVQYEAADYYECQHGQGRRGTRATLYSRIVRYFENEEWETFRSDPREVRISNKKIDASEFPALGS